MCSERWLQLFTPFLVRILARKEGKKQTPVLREEIAKACGKSPKWVDKISRMDSWDDVKLRDIRSFMTACGVTPRNFFRARFFICRTMTSPSEKCLTHIDRLPKKERAWMDRLIQSKTEKISKIISDEIHRGS